MASLETTRGRQVPAWQQANRYYQQPTDYVAEMQLRSQSATAPATRKRRKTNGGYTIQKGDTLSAIAKRYGTTVQAIAQANGIQDVNKIYVGDSLNIPGTTPAKTTQQPTKRTKEEPVKTNPTVTNNRGFTEEQMAGVNRYVKSLQPNVLTDTDFNTVRREKPIQQNRVPSQNISNSTLREMRENGLTANAGNYVDTRLYSAFRSRRYKSNKSNTKQSNKTFNKEKALSKAYNAAMSKKYSW